MFVKTKYLDIIFLKMEFSLRLMNKNVKVSWGIHYTVVPVCRLTAFELCPLYISLATTKGNKLMFHTIPVSNFVPHTTNGVGLFLHSNIGMNTYYT